MLADDIRATTAWLNEQSRMGRLNRAKLFQACKSLDEMAERAAFLERMPVPAAARMIKPGEAGKNVVGLK